MVTGDVRLPDGRGRSSSDPCLTTWEASSLGRWLRAVVSGHVQPTAFDSDGEDTLEILTEPSVALSLAAQTD